MPPVAQGDKNCYIWIMEYNNVTLFGNEYQVFYGSCCTSNSPKRTLYVEFTDVCNAHCPFCSAQHGTRVLSPKSLEKCLAELVSAGVVDRVSVTGGEPLIVPDYITLSNLFNVLDNGGLDYYAVTTNGRYLAKNFVLLDGLTKLKYLNISRHHYDDEANRDVFGDRDIPGLDTVAAILHMLKPDVIRSRLNCTMHTADINPEWIQSYIKSASEHDIKSILFRPDYFGTRNPTILNWFANNLAGRKDSTKCHCMHGHMGDVMVEYRDVDVALERRIEMSGSYIRNFVLHADGRLTGGWSNESIVLHEFG